MKKETYKELEKLMTEYPNKQFIEIFAKKYAKIKLDWLEKEIKKRAYPSKGIDKDMFVVDLWRIEELIKKAKEAEE